ncbi:MAG TPA: hypothetical protein VMZ00_11690 [Sporichthya sp.]|nr:hypothetical protein [Sporichthya sp.]
MSASPRPRDGRWWLAAHAVVFLALLVTFLVAYAWAPTDDLTDQPIVNGAALLLFPLAWIGLPWSAPLFLHNVDETVGWVESVLFIAPAALNLLLHAAYYEYRRRRRRRPVVLDRLEELLDKADG